MKFSIIIPTFERIDYLVSAIMSCLKQVFKDYEIIVIDDGSKTDIYQGLIRADLAGKVNFFRQVNSGVGSARNLGASKAKGEYLVFLDSDDLLNCYALKAYDKIIQVENPSIILAKRKAFVIEEDIIPHVIESIEYKLYKNYFSKDKINNQFGASNIVVERKKFLEHNGFRIKRADGIWHSEERCLLLQLGNEPNFVQIMNPSTVYYRVHTNNSITGKNAVTRGLIITAQRNRKNEFKGNFKNYINRYYIIGVPLFNNLISLIRVGEFRLSFVLISKVLDYLMFFPFLKIWVNIRDAFMYKLGIRKVFI